MENTIQHVEIIERRLELAEAEVWVSVKPAMMQRGLDVRGRWVGPRCARRTTIEVPYPIRPVSHAAEDTCLAGRTVIPDPSFWEPANPLLYTCVVELWHDGRRVDHLAVTHGFRSVRLGKPGLLWNEKPLYLRGVERTTISEAEAIPLQRDGYNLLIASVGSSPELDELAERLGFLVIHRWHEPCRPLPGTCGLGWLARREDLPKLAASLNEPNESKVRQRLLCPSRHVIFESDGHSLPAGIDAVCCIDLVPSAIQEGNLPILVRRSANQSSSLVVPGIMGGIDL